MDKELLGRIVLGHAPVIDRQGAVMATRLTVSLRQAGAMPELERLLKQVEEVWPAGGTPVVLNVRDEALLAEVLRARLPVSVMVELPSFLLGDPAHAERLPILHARGVPLLLQGELPATLPAPGRRCFSYQVRESALGLHAEGPQASPQDVQGLPFIQSGVRTQTEMEESFRWGAAAVTGWPIAGLPGESRARPAQPELETIIELIRRVDAGEDIDKLEAVLRRDPNLAFQLMRYINSPAFGLTVEFNSFRHAILLLGYLHLRRWLALLLATTCRDATSRPLVYASVRRGLLMEQLFASQSSDTERGGEMFICGVFSLLDRLFQRSFTELFDRLPVPQQVQQALLYGRGPYQPYLELVQALESGAAADIVQQAEALLLPMSEVNAALLGAILRAQQLD